MRGIARSALVTVVALVATVLLGVTSTFTLAITLAATALIVPGTGTPDPDDVENYMQNAVDYYIVPNAASCPVDDCNPGGVPYIAQFWPFPFEGWGGLSGAKWDVSVASGVDSLNQQLGMVPEDPVVIFGYSQGATVSSIVKRDLAEANGGLLPDGIFFVLIGNPNLPNGGLFERLAVLGHVPILDATFGEPTPTNTAPPGEINTVNIALQYDGVTDFPAYPINHLAVLNAAAGFQYIHGTYLAPDGDDPLTETPYGYTPAGLQIAMDCGQSPANCQVHGDTLYITIPAKTLPITQPFLDLGAATGTSALVEPIVDLVSPATQVLIETGYDRTDYGQPTPFRLIPPINPVTLTVDLVEAVQEGVENALAPGLAPLGPTTQSGPQTEPAPVSTRIAAVQQDPAPELTEATEQKTLTTTGTSKTETTPPTSKSKPASTETKRPKVRNPIGAELRKATKDVADAVDKVFKPSTTTKPDSTDTKDDIAGKADAASAGDNAPNDDGASKPAA